MNPGWNRKLPFGAGIVAFAVTFCVYLFTLCPTVGFIDSGELTAVCYTLGIAHPTGYPLYTLLGHLFSHLPLGSVARRVNLLSAFLSSLAAVALFGLVFSLCSGLARRAGNPGGNLDLSALAVRTTAGLVAALCFAFSSTFWSQATVAEVYNLTALFFCLLLFLIVRWLASGSSRHLLLFSYVFGLAFCNHMSVIHLILASLLLTLFSDRPWVLNPRRVALLGGLFLLGVSPYLYLPLRSAEGPLLNWGNPNTLERFLWHVSGKQYRVWMFSGSEETIFLNLRNFWSLYSDQFSRYLLWIPPLGLLGLFVRTWRLGLGFLLIVVSNLVLALNYDIPDIESYFLPTFLVAAVTFGVAVFFALELLQRSRTAPWGLRLAGCGLLFALPLFPLLGHFHKQDMSRNRIAYDFGMNALRSAGPGALVLTNNWDIYSPILYIELVEGKMTDIALVDKELLRRSWYFQYLEKRFPWLLHGSRGEVASFLEILSRFEHQRRFSPAERTETQRRYIAMLDSFIRESRGRGPVCVTFFVGSDPDAPEISPRLVRVPQGLVYRLEETDTIVAFSDEGFSWDGVFDASVHKDERTQVNLSNYPRMEFERGTYLFQRGVFGEASREFTQALRFWPDGPEVHENLGLCYMRMGRFRDAAAHFQAVLRSRPGDDVALQGLALIEKLEPR